MNPVKMTIFTLIVFLGGCNDSDFQGNSKFNDDSGPSEASNPSQSISDTPITGCTQGDFAKLKFPEPINSCINGVDENRIYDFSRRTCTPVAASSFECSFENLLSAAQRIGLTGVAIKEARDNGSLLVGCGEKDNGNVLVAQWFKPENQLDCNFDIGSNHIVTACFKSYSSNSPMPPANTEEEIEALVVSCIND
jgi:hypothetical protein